MPFCKTCDDTGKVCGAPDCGKGCKCPDCYCAWCSEAGKKIVGKDGDGDAICEECADEREARHEMTREWRDSL